MRRFAVVGVALSICFCGFAPVGTAANPRTAAVQVGLRAHGFEPGSVDGVAGPLTRAALMSFQRSKGLPPDGRLDRRTRRAFGPRGRPLLGQRELAVGAVGWDVAVLEFGLRRYGLGRRAVDGRFGLDTAAALRRYQRRHALVPDGIAGPLTYRLLARRGPVRVHVVRWGESFFSIAGHYHVSPWQLARRNRLRLTSVIVPDQRLVLPRGARLTAPTVTGPPANRDAVRAAIDRWARHYGVDPALARALAWMESGFQQDVVSNVGALGVMQLLPETWEFVDTVLLGVRTPRTYEGNVRAGVRYLRWQLDEFGGNRRLALAGWYQGARAVREIGLYDDTKLFVRVVLQLYGTV
ncbi:MAG: peptidoglycan-binding protein [Actinomycetota bacterium]|nr:peptidoglycan-binding protein [Actinomycetota bacterium]